MKFSAEIFSLQNSKFRFLYHNLSQFQVSCYYILMHWMKMSIFLYPLRFYWQSEDEYPWKEYRISCTRIKNFMEKFLKNRLYLAFDLDELAFVIAATMLKITIFSSFQNKMSVFPRPHFCQVHCILLFPFSKHYYTATVLTNTITIKWKSWCFYY